MRKRRGFPKRLRRFSLCAEVLDLIDATMQGKHGGNHKLEYIKIDNSKLDNAATGTTRQQALRKLRKDSPTLHADVLAGKLSPHAAK